MTDVLSDEQLLSLVRSGAPDAEDLLARRYSRVVRRCARPFFLRGGDTEDLMQEGMLGLLSAIREFDAGKGILFCTYAETCIRNRICSAVRSDAGKKHAPLNNGVPLDDFLSDESQSLGASFFQRSPEDQVLARESESEILSESAQRLSRFEAEVLALYLDGIPYRDIAAVLGRERKSIDNAISRIKKKLADLTPGDYSES